MSRHSPSHPLTTACGSIVLTVGLAMLPGCESIPDLGPEPSPANASAFDSNASLPDAAGAWPVEGWWKRFDDAQLNALIAEGLAGSPDIAVAAARVRAADALAQQVGAALLPSVGAEASAGGVQQSENMSPQPQFVPNGIDDVGQVNATFSFDIDLWGRNRAALAAATSEAEATRIDAAQARLMLSTEIASAYTDLAAYHNALDVANRAVQVRTASATLTRDRVRTGLENRASEKQAESREASAHADVETLNEALATTRNRLAALLGAGPDRGRHITRPTLASPRLALPADAGIELIGRRPDIAAARLRAEAAAKRIKVARTEFYPNVNLSALVGVQSLGISTLFGSGSSYGNAGLAISLPIFQGGRLQGRYRGARADYDVAVASYDGTLVAALRSVADIVAVRAATDRQLARRHDAAEAAREAARLTGLRYRAGLDNQIVHLTAEDSMVALDRSVVELEGRRLQLDIALIRALGGGYQEPQTVGKR